MMGVGGGENDRKNNVWGKKKKPRKISEVIPREIMLSKVADVTDHLQQVQLGRVDRGLQTYLHHPAIGRLKN